MEAKLTKRHKTSTWKALDTLENIAIERGHCADGCADGSGGRCPYQAMNLSATVTIKLAT